MYHSPLPGHFVIMKPSQGYTDQLFSYKTQGTDGQPGAPSHRAIQPASIDDSFYPYPEVILLLPDPTGMQIGGMDCCWHGQD